MHTHVAEAEVSYNQQNTQKKMKRKKKEASNCQKQNRFCAIQPRNKNAYERLYFNTPGKVSSSGIS
jgi:hypothetical protein